METLSRSLSGFLCYAFVTLLVPPPVFLVVFIIVEGPVVFRHSRSFRRFTFLRTPACGNPVMVVLGKVPHGLLKSGSKLRLRRSVRDTAFMVKGKGKPIRAVPLRSAKKKASTHKEKAMFE